MQAVSTELGTVHVGDWVHYRGSLTWMHGHLIKITAIERGGMLAAETATGGLIQDMRITSIKPCVPGCDCGWRRA